MRKILFFLFFTSVTNLTFSQYVWQQYFDGIDTSSSSSVIISLDTLGNIWQIGTPQKDIFDSAATLPKAIVTDTINFYPVNNSSSFEFLIKPEMFPAPWGIVAIQWSQKLDMEQGIDGGYIEYSIDHNTWYNVFNNPYVYNFYGFQNSNKDTLSDGTFCFSGTDSTWKDIWLCYDHSWAWSISDSMFFRYTFRSDSNDTQQQGWMIDNMMVHLTFVHTVNEMESEYMQVFPNLTSGLVNIKTKKLTEYHIIEKMELRDSNGKLVQTFGLAPTKFSIDIGHHPDGIYFLTVQTNKKTETFKIILQH